MYLVYHYPAVVAIAGAKYWSFEVIKLTIIPLLLDNTTHSTLHREYHYNMAVTCVEKLKGNITSGITRYGNHFEKYFSHHSIAAAAGSLT